jgi:3-phenylpropionate/trans-cinnamate dioxygenase ferredoxin reductase component
VLRYTYLIVGGGMTADAAVRGIREVDPGGSIGLVGAEADPPYKRPPLSKKLWAGKPLDSVWLEAGDRGAAIHLGRTVRALDLRAKRAVDDRGTTYAFDKLLLATGARPRRLPVGGHRVIHYRTLDDYRRLRTLADRGRRFAVVGGGFIGSEIAAALTANGKQVVMVFPGEAIGDRLFPRDLARSLNDAYRERGVEVLARHSVARVDERGDGLVLRARGTDTGRERAIPVDGVVAGIGTEPNVELATAAGLDVAGGIVVDDHLRTRHPDVYAAGDVASFRLHPFGVRRRVEHEDNARTMGRLAGRAMAGDPAPYHHLPFFYSDLFDLGYEAVGDLDPRLETVADWTEPYREGVVYYLRDGRVRGVLLWNVWRQVEAARRLIAEPGPFRPLDLEGRLPLAS